MIIKVHEDNFYKATKDLKKLQKKFETNGYRFNYTQIDITEAIVNHSVVRYFIFDIEADIFNKKWQFIAFLEKTNNGILIKGFETEKHFDYLKKYTENITMYCEHCNQFRELKYAVVIYNKETGEYKIVGKSCLKKYTSNLSVEIIERRYKDFEALNNEYQYSKSNSNSNLFELNYIISVAENVIKRLGYVSNKMSFDTDKLSTSAVVKAIVKENYNLLINDENYKNIIDDEFLEKIKESNSNIGEIVKFINEKHNVDSVFDNNIKTIFNNKIINLDNTGLICFGIFEFNKSQNKKEEIGGYESEFIGNVGEKITIDVVSYSLIYANVCEHWISRLYKIIDKFGNVFIWKTNKCINEEVFNINNEELINTPIVVNKTITGKVKEHKTFNNVKQTVINYVKVVK